MTHLRELQATDLGPDLLECYSGAALFVLNGFCLCVATLTRGTPPPLPCPLCSSTSPAVSVGGEGRREAARACRVARAVPQLQCLPATRLPACLLLTLPSASQTHSLSFVFTCSADNTIFLFLFACVAYGVGSCLAGQTARLPLVADAADAQVR